MSTKLATDRQVAVAHAASVKLINVQAFVSVKLITWARLEVYRWMEVQWCWIEVSGHLHVSVALLPGKEESLVPTEQEFGWSGHYDVHRAGIQSLYRLSSLAWPTRCTNMSSLACSAPTGMWILHACCRQTVWTYVNVTRLYCWLGT